MRRVDGSFLWIGNVQDARDARLLFQAGLQAVLDLAIEETPTTVPRELAYVRFPLVDGAGNSPWLIRAAIDFTAKMNANRVPTLVFCAMGMSRSPCIVAAALALRHGGRPDDYLVQVLGSGPADIAPGLLAEVSDAVECIRQKDQIPL